jgi:hypothetical protein
VNEVHEWNVVVVNEYGFPRKPHEEFQVLSKSIHGAIMKASRKLKEDYTGWKIKSVWYLDPKRPKRNIS